MCVKSVAMNKVCIGYLHPHVSRPDIQFFWRERLALQELGVDSRLVSTRHPPKGIVASLAVAEDGEMCHLEIAHIFSHMHSAQAMAALLEEV